MKTIILIFLLIMICRYVIAEEDFIVTQTKEAMFYADDRDTLVNSEIEFWQKILSSIKEEGYNTYNSYFLWIEYWDVRENSQDKICYYWIYPKPEDIPMGEIYDPIHKQRVIQYKYNHGYMPLWKEGKLSDLT